MPTCFSLELPTQISILRTLSFDASLVARPHKTQSHFSLKCCTQIQPERLMTYPSVFKAYAQMGLVHEGAQLHGRVLKLGLENDEFIRNFLIHMEIEDAQNLFDKMPTRTSVTWNSMISGYVRNGKMMEALELFQRMQQEEEGFV
ncbi:hypothetical protein K1719_027578 [Acacia pycnantha]|nr:hypothetical protein K1719_027578 [Acacia pycnantha]